MKLKIDGDEATLTRRGTMVFVRTQKRVWMLHAPDAGTLADSLAEKSTIHDLEERGFIALK